MDDESNGFERDPKQWKLGNDRMSDAQRLELEFLSNLTGEHEPAEDFTKAEASERIESLRVKAKNAGFGSETDTDTDTVLGDDE